MKQFQGELEMNTILMAPNYSTAGFLNHGIIDSDILGGMSLCYGCYFVRCTMVSNIPGIFALHANNTHSKFL